jgi:hypothetical protein
MNTSVESEEERQLCISCLAPNFSDAHFCEKCGAPLDSYAATAPFEQIFAQGHAFRSATTGKPKLVVMIGMWLLFLPSILILFVQFRLYYTEQFPIFPTILISLPYAIIGSALIFHTTKNYLKKTSDNTSNNDTEQDAAANP